MKLYVDLGRDSYPIYVSNNILADPCPYISQIFSGEKIIIVSDDNVYPLYGEKLRSALSRAYQCFHVVLPHGESTKSFVNVPALYNAMLSTHITRTDLVIALGGGVIGDLAGFAAATFLRGVKYIQIPTSLLAQIDASIGGKVAVDLPQGKNLVGSFYQPRLVLVDPTVLDTLPARQIGDGMGEIIKSGCIQDETLIETLENAGTFHGLKKNLATVISSCIQIKKQIVERDQFDTGDRMLLNFGHTLGHAIEQHFKYRRETHGEAVGIGMYQITRMAEEKGLTAAGTADRIKNLLLSYHLPIECEVPLCMLFRAISLDKKNIEGSLNLVLLRSVGQSYIHSTDIGFFDDPNRMI